MGDLHLPFGRQKPMDIFGGWENYTERIEKNWNSVVGEDDCVVIPGDISWAMSIEEALPDFEFISRRLRGRKIISKGNHDYWWTTLKKMNGFLQTNGFDNIRILHNNAFEECGIAICGTRGWINDDGEPQDELVLLREAGRMDASLKAAVSTGKDAFTVTFTVLRAFRRLFRAKGTELHTEWYRLTMLNLHLYLCRNKIQ